MWAAMRLCFLLACSAVAAQPARFGDLWAKEAAFNDYAPPSNTTNYQLPPCAKACEERFVPNHDCDVAPIDKACCRPTADSSLTRCIQATCPLLENLLSWQYYRGQVCELEPANNNVVETTTSYVLFALSSLSMGARFLSRSELMSGPGFWWDDWVALIVYLLSVEMIVCLPFLSRNGAGTSILSGVTVEQLNRMVLWEYVSIPFYLIGTYGSKIIMLLLYLRMWEANTRFRTCCWYSLAILVAAIVGYGIAGLVIVWPLRYYIGDSAKIRQNFYGVEIYPAITSIGVLNVLADFWVILMPIMKVAALRGISKTKRLGISIVFLLGFVVTGCSIVRITHIGALRNSLDLSWDIGMFGFWSEIEVHLSTFTANLPATVGLIHRLRFKYRAHGRMRMISSPSHQLSSNATTTTTGATSSVAKQSLSIQKHPPSASSQGMAESPSSSDGKVSPASDTVP